MTLPANMPAESIALGLAVLELLALIVEKYKASHDPDHNPFSRNFSGDVTIRLPNIQWTISVWCKTILHSCK